MGERKSTHLSEDENENKNKEKGKKIGEETYNSEGSEYKSFSDVSISTISNSSGIASDVYYDVVKKFKKKEKRRKRKRRNERNRKENYCSNEDEVLTNSERENIKKKEKYRKRSKHYKRSDRSRSYNSPQTNISEGEEEREIDRKSKRRKRKSSHSSFDGKKNYDYNRKYKHKSEKMISDVMPNYRNSSRTSRSRNRSKIDKRRNRSRSSDSRSNSISYPEENIPKDPFNPLLLAYVKEDTSTNYDKRREDDEETYSSKWQHDKYETSCSETDEEVEKKIPYKVDSSNIRKNLWRSKAGGVCVPEMPEDDMF